ncbi:MAG TPA: FeoB-associated Cys-rich membrane protein [Phycisphaerae bacterium]|nr:FeoB-associated Cys-rich membrane protein [Phycisphaerae bacterium]
MMEEVVVGVIVAGVAALSLRSAYRSFKRGQPGCGCGPGGCPIDRPIGRTADPWGQEKSGPASTVAPGEQE